MLKAVIFDYNGILVDDERLHMELFQEILAEFNVPLPEEEYFSTYFGYSDRDLLNEIFAAHEVKVRRGRIDKLIRRKNQRYMEVIAQRSILVPGVKDVVESFAEAYPLGIVSGALRGEIDAVLVREGMDGHFRYVVAAEDVTRGKPDPEGLVVALNQVNRLADLSLLPVNPSECLVIEDSPSGIAAARSLGMRSVGIAVSVDPEHLAAADLVYNSLAEIRMDQVRDLFAGPLDDVTREDPRKNPAVGDVAPPTSTRRRP